LTNRWERNRCTDVLRKRRPNGRRATADRYPIRPARPADVEDVREIERVVFSDPWSAGDFAQCLESGVPFLVAEQQGTIAGYVVAHGAADEGEILNLGVAPAHRRRGVGRALVERVLALLAGRGARAVFLEVRESNAVARRLYQSLGFAEVARRARYYRRPVEDAVVLRAAIPADGVIAKL
jgi:ribosomal-protein-alanine N-acetyltransferase